MVVEKPRTIHSDSASPTRDVAPETELDLAVTEDRRRRNPGPAPTGRLWTLVPDTYSYRPPVAFAPCEDVAPSKAGDLRLSCYETTG